MTVTHEGRARSLRAWLARTDWLFPRQRVFSRSLTLLQSAGLFLVLFLLFLPLGFLLPANGFFAFDWLHFFGQGNIPAFYPPWTIYVVRVLSWPSLVSLTLASFALAAFLRSSHPLSMALAFLTLPLLWTVFLGQVDGLVLLGVLGLPFLAPLVLLKPQVSIFAFAARRSYLAALLVVLLLSFLLWGFWPRQVFSVWVVHQEGRYVDDISLGLYGLLIAIPLLWLSRGDVDMLMLAGSFVSPYLLPYNLIVVMPSIARLSPRSALLACLLSWLPFSANWLGPWGWFLGWLAVAWIWGDLGRQRYALTWEKVRSRL
jgi:hypothetical protein